MCYKGFYWLIESFVRDPWWIVIMHCAYQVLDVLPEDVSEGAGGLEREGRSGSSRLDHPAVPEAEGERTVRECPFDRGAKF